MLLSLSVQRRRCPPDGEIFEVITKGRGRMGAYGGAIPVADRWAIIAHVRVLQAAQADAASTPPEPAPERAGSSDESQ